MIEPCLNFRPLSWDPGLCVCGGMAEQHEPQDPAADAAEDEAFRAAIARVEAAEAREDAAEVETKARRARDFHEHLDECPRCEGSPFNLCAKGVELLERVGKADG